MAARLAPTPADASSSLALDALWLRTLQRICGRAAHEFKGVLNGVSVNLEVVRSRAAKADAAASTVSKFAESASGQFEAVLAMSDALLALSRRAEPPAEIGSMVTRIVALLAPVARVDGRRIDLDGGFELLGATTAPTAARLAIGESLLAATDASAQVVCRAAPPALRIESTDGAMLPAPANDVAEALREAGIVVRTDSSAITISFPRMQGKAEIV